jgi:hypothetical protein
VTTESSPPAESKPPALILDFTATADLRSEVDPVQFYADMGPRQRPFYTRWKSTDDEYWDGSDVPGWMKPYAYLVSYFIDACEASAPWAPGFTDRTDLSHDGDRVSKRGSAYVYGRDGRTWTEADYNTLLQAVPWLMVLDDPERAADYERAQPQPGDQPMFEAGESE